MTTTIGEMFYWIFHDFTGIFIIKAISRCVEWLMFVHDIVIMKIYQSWKE
jgi:hypothetical protein